MNTIIVYTDKVDNKLNNSFIENFIYNSSTMVITKNENTENAIILRGKAEKTRNLKNINIIYNSEVQYGKVFRGRNEEEPTRNN